MEHFTVVKLALAPGGYTAATARSVLQHKRDDDYDEDSHDKGELTRTERPQPAPGDDARSASSAMNSRVSASKKPESRGLDLFLLIHRIILLSSGRSVCCRSPWSSCCGDDGRAPASCSDPQNNFMSPRCGMMWSTSVALMYRPSFIPFRTQSVGFQELLSCFLPLQVVTPRIGTALPSGCISLWISQYLVTVWYERRTAGMPARCLRS